MVPQDGCISIDVSGGAVVGIRNNRLSEVVKFSTSSVVLLFLLVRHFSPLFEFRSVHELSQGSIKMSLVFMGIFAGV